jgi:hypothetical protein
MLKDNKRFADSGGWGYAQFEFNDASDTFAHCVRKSSHRAAASSDTDRDDAALRSG